MAVDDDVVRLDETEPGIARLRIDRPEVLNAINWDVYQALERRLGEVAHMHDVRVLLLCGSGRAFSAGGDITFMREMFEGTIDPQDVGDLGLRVFRALVELPQPTIAVVDGPAIGVACTLALCCDLIYASDRARFADPHLQMGLVPGDGGAVVWPLRIGLARAKEFLFTGDPITAPDALAMGLINHVHSSEDVHDAALSMARRLANGPVAALRATKAITNHVLRDLGDRLVPASLALEHVSQYSAYHRDAVRRFLDGDPVRY
jgi:enoyl-CoA hydratase